MITLRLILVTSSFTSVISVFIASISALLPVGISVSTFGCKNKKLKFYYSHKMKENKNIFNFILII